MDLDVSPLLAARLERLAIATLDDVRRYLAEHPAGCENIGRVHLEEMKALVAE